MAEHGGFGGLRHGGHGTLGGLRHGGHGTLGGLRHDGHGGLGGLRLGGHGGHGGLRLGGHGGLRLGGAEEVSGLALHVECDWRLRGRGVCAGCDALRHALRHEAGDRRTHGTAADAVLTSQSSDGLALRVRGAEVSHVGGPAGREGGAASDVVALGLGGAQSVAGQFPLEIALEFAGSGEGLHHELHSGQQFAGAWVTSGEVPRGERPVVDTQGEAAGVQAVEHVEDVPGAVYEAEHPGDVHGATRPCLRRQSGEPRALERVRAAGGTHSSLNGTGSWIPASSGTRFCRAVGREPAETACRAGSPSGAPSVRRCRTFARSAGPAWMPSPTSSIIARAGPTGIALRQRSTLTS
ncbi:hypothetical protein OG244_38130 [Streptomyces brevispora]|uniref:hypothetical protein n=1 Tax=Streptomyces brevispora TaxID=887462 RepID=UPI002E373FE6|nr:hypothetical protein [Streptomyces brevispora]